MRMRGKERRLAIGTQPSLSCACNKKDGRADMGEGIAHCTLKQKWTAMETEADDMVHMTSQCLSPRKRIACRA